MKRICLAALAALIIAGTASAQAQAAPTQPPQAQAQVTTISGKLELIDGMIGLKAGGISYYTPRLRQLVGFVKDLQEGAQVTLTGYALPLPQRAGYALFAATKLSFGGKDYDLGQSVGPMGRGWMRGAGRGGMMEGPRW
jgi:opacity protein-like surface antigen